MRASAAPATIGAAMLVPVHPAYASVSISVSAPSSSSPPPSPPEPPRRAFNWYEYRFPTSSSNAAAVTSTPGANKSTHGPVMPSLHVRSLISLAATVITEGSRPGENRHASEVRRERSAFPAATTTTTLCRRTTSATARSSALDGTPIGTPSDSVSAAGGSSYAGRLR
eukprot:31131-Pelagococcus_subviridis.AAC.7